MKHLGGLISDGYIKTLPNGLRIWIIPKPSKHCKSHDKVHIGLYIYNGTNTENEASVEYSHILEHLLAVFPSAKYPNSRNNNSLLELNGITSFGTVENYKTHIWLEGLPKVFNLMLDVFINGLTDFSVDDTIFEQEKVAVLTELTDLLNDPFLKLDELQHNTLFKGHPISIPMKKHISNVKLAKPTQLEKFFKNMLTPHNMIIYISGKLGKNVYKNAVDLLTKTFTNLKNPKQSLKITRLNRKLPTQNVHFIKNNTTTTEIKWTWLTYIKHGEYNCYIVDAIHSMLKDLLFDELRMNKGLIYSLKTECVCDPINKKLSFLTISTNVIGKHQLIKLLTYFETLVKHLKFNTDSLLQYKRKTYRDYQDKFGDCTLDHPVDTHIDNLLYTNNPISIEDDLKQRLNIKLTDVNNFIKKHFTLDRLYTFYSGKHSLKPYYSLSARLNTR